ncbi:hypothetical protein ACI8AF_02895 [Blastococcus sp. SYSU D00669]
MTELLTGTRRAVEAATLAPSSHNTQPWRFRVRGDTVDLLADRTRELPVNDPVDRELTIGCGAALANLVVAARAGGLEPAVEVVPDPGDTDLLARVVLRATGDRAERELAAAIPARHTYREQFADGPADGTLARMARGCADLGVALYVVTGDADRAAPADLVAEADRARFDDPSWRRELAAWMHPRRRGDGLTVPPVTGALTRFVVSHVDVGAGTAGEDAEHRPPPAGPPPRRAGPTAASCAPPSAGGRLRLRVTPGRRPRHATSPRPRWGRGLVRAVRELSPGCW